MDGAKGALGRICGAACLLVATLGACADKAAPSRRIAGADPERGLALMERAGCPACHAIPGISWPRGSAGGSLAGFGRRPLIAGRFPNQPEQLVAWLQDAPALDPDVAMPPSGLSEKDARDIAAYLYSLDER